MKKNYFLIAALFFGFPAFSQGNGFWQPYDGSRVPSAGVQTIQPKKFAIQQLNQGNLKSFLFGLPSHANEGQILELPSPDGGILSFKVWKTSMMEPELQAKYPDIQTFTAYLLDNPTVTAKLDFTLSGFHAMIFNGENTYFIDPYSNENNGFYTVYYKKDYEKPVHLRMSCEYVGQEELMPDKSIQLNLNEQSVESTPMKEYGTTQKTYRLALSCTGEYAVAVAGSNPTKAAVLSAMTTTMNRVNGVYEREVATTMVLIANNDDIIYTNAATDPFTGNANYNGPQLLSMNHNNLNTVIGSSNYDIGHIFSTGGGGIASLSSVCSNNRKGQGVTGLPNPVGDAYDIDYVSHEMGHQFGANHIFNANTGSCSGNGNQSTAYELGGGSTIMGYAGICGSGNDIQNHSDDYFHAVTLNEISSFLVANYGGNNGGGATCGTTNAGITAPLLPALTGTYNIPMNTPFELSMPEGTETGLNVVYNWEQYDLGSFRSDEMVAASKTTGPTFRSYSPTFQQIRIFPPLDKLLVGNMSSVGIRFPTVARSLNFKATVRKIENGWGSFNYSNTNLKVQVIPTSNPFKVTSQSVSSTTWNGNTTETITWTVGETNQAPIDCQTVSIYLSTDGGTSFSTLLAENVPNNGSAQIQVPNIQTNHARVKVKGDNNIFFNINSKTFKIQQGNGPSGINDVNDFSSHIQVYPNPAQQIFNVEVRDLGHVQLALINAMGQIVWSGESENGKKSIVVENFARGVYFLNIQDLKTGDKVVKKINLK